MRIWRRNETIEFVLSVISDIKKDPKWAGGNHIPQDLWAGIESSTMTWPRACRKRRGIDFSVLLATVAFSNCVTEQRRYLRVALHGEPPVLCGGGTWGSRGLTPANTHLYSLLWIIQVMSALTQLYLTRLWWLLTLSVVTLTNPRVMKIKRGYQIIFAIVKHRHIKNHPF